LVDVAFVEQIVYSMGTAILQLERAILKKNFDEANKLRTFIFDLYSQLDKEMGRRHV